MNLLAIGYLSCAVFCLLLSSFVMGRHEKSPVRDAFLIQVFFFLIWQVGTYEVLVAPNAYWATIFSRIAYAGCIFLSVASYQLVVNFCSLKSQFKFVTLGYCLGAIVFFPLLFTDQLMTQAYLYPWGYWFHAGRLHPLYLIFFTVYGWASFINLIVQQAKVTDRSEKGKYRFLFWAYFIVYFSNIDFWPDYGYPVLPLGFLFTSIWLITIWVVIKPYDYFSMWRRILR